MHGGGKDSTRRSNEKGPEDEAEVSGFHDDKGEFVVFNPPLKVKLSGIPAGEIEDHVTNMVAKHYEEVVLREKSSSSS